jgi:gamma-glutamyltranspeptidase/glutathione hydrolase
MRARWIAMVTVAALATSAPGAVRAERTQKPVLHAQRWLAITGKPLAATAGAKMFEKGGNAMDAAAAMLAATCTMWDVLSWGGETQLLVYDPRAKKVIALNALGVAPTGATAAFFKKQGLKYPPEYGPLAAVTPGTPGGLMTMLAEWGTLRLADVLAPAIELADGYPIESETADSIERNKERLKAWPYSRAVLLPHLGKEREAPVAGELFRQPELAATLRKLVEAEAQALAAGKSREQAIMAAYDRFYRGDIARELVRGVREQGGLITLEDLDRWRVRIEEPVKTDYRGVEVYKLTHWVQGPVMLQTLNILESFDLRAMGYNSPRYIHTIYQAMNLAFADRDFYYGDPYFPPAEPIRGLLSKEYARERAKTIDPERNDPKVRPGDPYPYQGEKNPFRGLLERWGRTAADGSLGTSGTPADAPALALGEARAAGSTAPAQDSVEAFYRGTTSIEAADASGWVVSVTPSGGWIPAVIAGHTGVGLSQRMQSFVLDPAENPFNVVEPGKRPRSTLTPSLALKDGKPFLAFAVQGGDTQDQNLLQFFLDVVEFGMNVQEAAEAPNFNSFQMRSSFGAHESKPGRILVADRTTPAVRSELEKMGYQLTFESRTSGPITAILLDAEHGTMWGAASNHGDDYGIGW